MVNVCVFELPECKDWVCGFPPALQKYVSETNWELQKCVWLLFVGLYIISSQNLIHLEISPWEQTTRPRCIKAAVENHNDYTPID